ncbi:helix-turn-helix domain-containing protein [Phaeacidiphilus oryzae]|uniref:helix-turn-helix domain-containing protein n=1 Tax=Phaeacidiphilus oryzae TaxID=348818 RepID=UPI001F351A7C|nr:helix-turn-helix transcriptional regulator [Phaeacidiphilus oryzae]
MLVRGDRRHTHRLVADFARDLKGLKATCGLSLRALAPRAGYSPGALSKATAGDRLPSLTMTKQYVQACGGDVGHWVDRWRYVHDRLEAVDRAAQHAEATVEPLERTDLTGALIDLPAPESPRARFAVYLRALYEQQSLPMDRITISSGVPMRELVGWMNDQPLPRTWGPVGKVLEAFGSGQGEVKALRDLYDMAIAPAKKQSRRVSVDVRFGGELLVRIDTPALVLLGITLLAIIAAGVLTGNLLAPT